MAFVSTSHFWQALIDRDGEAIHKYCLELNAGEKLYRLLACMITARSWENVEGGITNSKRTEIEACIVRL